MTRVLVASLVATMLGCVSEYHPEYHPVSVVSIQQTATLHDPPPPPTYLELFHDRESDPFAISEAYTAPVAVEQRVPQASRGSVQIGGNVRIYGNVEIHGDVYIDTRR